MYLLYQFFFIHPINKSLTAMNFVNNSAGFFYIFQQMTGSISEQIKIKFGNKRRAIY